MVVLELTIAEVKIIATIMGNLMVSAFDADVECSKLETIYYKASNLLDELDN